MRSAYDPYGFSFTNLEVLIMSNTKNKVKYGLKNVYYAKATFDDDNNVTYGTPVRIPGAVSLSLDNNAEIESWYADDMVYVVLTGAASYEGTLEIALLPDSFLTDILHEELDSNGVLAEVDGAEIESFALLFEFDGDKHKTRHCLYNCVANRPSIESETKEDSAEPATDELDITASALANGYVKVKTTADVDTEVYNSWFTKVYTPDGFTASEGGEG